MQPGAKTLAHYLKYWKPQTVADSLPTLNFSASDQYGKIRPGDVLWIVTSEEPGDLVLVGRQKVKRVVGRDEARKVLRTARLWPADFYAISDEPEDKYPIDISRHAYDLVFDGGVTKLPEGFTGQHLQAMRRLDFDSAQLLERLWRDREDLIDSQ
jgi:hypothetical protein